MENVQRDSPIQYLLKNASWLLLGNIGSAIFSFLHNIFAARMLGVYQFGVLALILAYVYTINQIFESRVWEAAIKYITQFLAEGDRQRATAMVKLCYAIDLCAAFVTLVAIELTVQLALRFIIKERSAETALRLYGTLALLLIPRGTGYALLRIGNRFRWQAMQIAGMAAIRMIGVGILWKFGGGIVEIVWCHLFSWAVGMIWLAALSRQVARSLDLLPWREAPLRLLKPQLQELRRFLLTTNAISFLQALQQSGEPLLLGFWLSPMDVGYLRTARSLSELMGFPIQPLYTTSYPKFVQLYQQGEQAELKKLVGRIVGITLPFAIGCAAFLALFGERLLIQCYGKHYAPAAPILTWLAIGSAIALVVNFIHPLLTAINRIALSLTATAIGIIYQLATLFYAVPHFGAVSAGMGLTVYWCVWSVAVGVGIRFYVPRYSETSR